MHPLVIPCHWHAVSAMNCMDVAPAMVYVTASRDSNISFVKVTGRVVLQAHSSPPQRTNRNLHLASQETKENLSIQLAT